MTEIYSRNGDQLEMSSKMYRNSRIKSFIAGAIAMAIIFTVIVKINSPVMEIFDYDHPTQRIVECPLVFTDMNGLMIDKNSNDQWELTADQDVLVWFDLPSDIDKLRADIKSYYPYDVKAGNKGTIKMEVYCYENSTKYVGSLDFVAADDLTIGSVCHGNYGTNTWVEVQNATTRRLSWMEAEKYAYVHYPLYTSCAGEYNVYPIRGGVLCSGVSASFDIIAKGAPEMLYISNRPDGSVELEENEQVLNAAIKKGGWGFIGKGANMDD